MNYKAVPSVVSSPSPKFKACKSEIALIASVKITWSNCIVQKKVKNNYNVLSSAK